VTTTQKVFAGLIAAAILIFVAVQFAKSNDSPTGTCAVTAGVFEVIATRVHAGNDYGKIAAAVGVGGACEAAIKTWVDKPSEPVNLTVDGQSDAVPVTGGQVNTLGTQQPTRLSYCLSRYKLFTANEEACMAGTIN
jgi:hypothetical protein